MSQTLTVKEAQENSPAMIFQQAISAGAGVEQIEKLMEMQFKWEQNEARKAFSQAMVNVQREIKAIAKTEKNQQTHSTYASLDKVIVETKLIYTKEGFSISFYEGNGAPEGHIRVGADVCHEKGHKESYHYDVPLDGVGIKGNANMTATHGKASSTSYGRRYLMCMIWNIPTGDDNDGNGAPKEQIEYITDKQLSTIRDFLIELGMEKNELKFAKFLKVESLEKLPASKYKQAISVLEAKKAKVQK